MQRIIEWNEMMSNLSDEDPYSIAVTATRLLYIAIAAVLLWLSRKVYERWIAYRAASALNLHLSSQQEQILRISAGESFESLKFTEELVGVRIQVGNEIIHDGEAANAQQWRDEAEAMVSAGFLQAEKNGTYDLTQRGMERGRELLEHRVGHKT